MWIRTTSKGPVMASLIKDMVRQKRRKSLRVYNDLILRVIAIIALFALLALIAALVYPILYL